MLSQSKTRRKKKANPDIDLRAYSHATGTKHQILTLTLFHWDIFVLCALSL